MASQTAAERYEQNQKEIADKTAKISKLLIAHKSLQKKDARNWGFVGDVAEVNSKLDEILSFLTNAG